MSSRSFFNFKAFWIWFFCHRLGRTWTYTFSGRADFNPMLANVDNGVIYCFWHAQILQFAYCYRHLNIITVVSSSRDGDLAVAVAERWGHSFIRGSSSKRGFSALRETVRTIKEGRKVVLIPDGPTGPAGVAKAGVADVALLSRAPLVPLSARADRCWRLKSWDRFIIPKPFANIAITFHDPIVVISQENHEERIKHISRHIERVLEKP
jgi:hypothetical protein